MATSRAAEPSSGRDTAALWVVLAALVVVAVVWVAVRPDGARGPLTTPEADTAADQNSLGTPSLRIGDTYCYGMMAFRNPSEHTAVLDRVVAHGDARGVRVGTPMVLGPDREDYLTASWNECPGAAMALHGQQVPPGAGMGEDDGLELVLPITVVARGKHRITGVSVFYTVDGRRYHLDQFTDLVSCTYACESRPGGR